MRDAFRSLQVKPRYSANNFVRAALSNSHVRQVRSCLFGRLFRVLHRNIAVLHVSFRGRGEETRLSLLSALFREQLCQSRPRKQPRARSTFLSVRAALPCSSSEHRGFTRFFSWGRGREIARFCYALFREQLCQSRHLKQSRTTSTLLSVRAALPCSSSEYRGFTRFFLWARERNKVVAVIRAIPRTTLSEPPSQTVTYDRYAPVCSGRLFCFD